MTASNYHSLIMFLEACNFREKEIQSEIWKIQDLIKTNDFLTKEIKDTDLL